jgi:hypothetical protein
LSFLKKIFFTTDIAIGAPYGGKDGRGVVYIYHGSMKGIITDVQQVGSNFIPLQMFVILI